MISLLLNVLYLCLAVLSGPFLLISYLRGKRRSGWRQKLWGDLPKREGNERCIWLHAVSVGEVNLLSVLVDQFETNSPETTLVITTTSNTGYALATKKFSARHQVCFCPLDFSWAVNRALRAIRPDQLILMELELWPNLIRLAKRHGAKVSIVNGRLSAKSFRGYRKAKPFFAWLFQSIDLIAAQDREYAERFTELGAKKESVVVTGSLKFDGAITNRNNTATQSLANLVKLQSQDTVLLAGSTQAGEEAAALAVFRQLQSVHPKLRLFLAPRHPERFAEVATLCEQSGLPWSLRSEITSESKPTPVMLINTIGELAAWWGVADIAFVGGSMGSRGGQNMIEPAAYGAAVCFGPNTRNFKDIVSQLLSNDAAVVVADETELGEFVRHCLQDQSYGQILGGNAQRLVLSQQGALAKTMTALSMAEPLGTADNRFERKPLNDAA